MSVPTLDPEKQLLVLRIKAEGMVFWAQPSEVLEEVPSLYKGFEVWGKDQLIPAPLDTILRTHKEMRLFVRLPEQEPVFCDLTEDVVQADPFSLLKVAVEKGLELWEYNALQKETSRVFPTEDGVNPYAELLEDSLFHPSSS